MQKSDLAYQLERFGLVIVWVAFIALFGALRPDTFLTWSNFSTIFGSEAVLVIVTLGLMIPLTAGDFDLSIAQTLTLVSMATAILDARMDLPLALVLPLGLAIGAFIGLINGAITLYFRVHSLIVTLGVGTFLHGITLWIGNSQTISGVSPVLMEWVIIQRVMGIPVAFYYAIALAFLIWYMLSYTAFGQHLLFTGRGREVGRLTGVAVGKVRLTAFVLSGVLGAFAGILYTGTTGSANPSSGTFLLLPAFAAAFLGATCIRPGRFNPWGSVIAVYFLVTGINGLSVLGFRTFVQDLFYGGALVLAVMVSQLVSGRKERGL
ncbi:ribose transport system permease protein [Lutimaribacter pacificus]|uniref:Monosaccharide ABC transporter membrane protein, CUT2 family n=1 Tax=Lutimaribacter pacificus TaxID=391948 RepID=A0A1H0L3W0_9RHOB|nr:ABC transporter permease [Lutimaribacter pacificus]SDO62713.1 ribose transport system permease protein [Lutimaribacter pacificus]SHK71223.1 monosaccharide ABC transporter membrane protein, CUT2 family [Lutimaribacter pacificus]